MTKYCPNCGTPNDDNAKFCIKCGYNFGQQTQQNVPPQPFQQQQVPPQQAQYQQPQPSPPPPYQQQPQPSPSAYQQPQAYPSGPQSPQGYPGASAYLPPAFQSARTMALVAFIFSIILLVLYIIGIISDGVDIATINTYVSMGSLLPIYASAILDELYIYIVIYIIFLAFDIIILLRTYRIYNLIRFSRFQEAHQLDSILWIIFGFIFGGIITGVFLLLTKINLEKGLGYPSTF